MTPRYKIALFLYYSYHKKKSEFFFTSLVFLYAMGPNFYNFYYTKQKKQKSGITELFFLISSRQLHMQILRFFFTRVTITQRELTPKQVYPYNSQDILRISRFTVLSLSKTFSYFILSPDASLVLPNKLQKGKIPPPTPK